MSIAHEHLPNTELLRGVQILVVDNDLDNRDLYAFLLESYGAEVTTAGSIKDALDLLSWYVPTVLICEVRFLGESIHPLIQEVCSLALSSGKPIPILGTSTCALTSLAHQWKSDVTTYLLKPVVLDHLVYEVCKLVLLPKILHPQILHPLNIQDWIAKQNIDKTRQDKTRQDETLCCVSQTKHEMLEPLYKLNQCASWIKHLIIRSKNWKISIDAKMTF